MSELLNKFISSIQSKNLVSITFDANEKGVITRKCVPFDYAVSKRYKDGLERFHLLDLNSPDGTHNLGILESQILELEILDENFEPGDYVKWIPNWSIKRDWGKYS